MRPCFYNSLSSISISKLEKNTQLTKSNEMSCLSWLPSLRHFSTGWFPKMDDGCFLKNWFPNAGQQRPDRTGFPSVLRLEPICSTSECCTPSCKACWWPGIQFSKERPLNWPGASKKSQQLLGYYPQIRAVKMPVVLLLYLHVG